MKKEILNVLKKSLQGILVLGLLVSSFDMTTVKAQEIVHNNDFNNKNLLPNYLLEEAKVDNTALSKKKEMELNLRGVLDEEINQFDEKTMKLLESDKDYSVNVQYYEVFDDEDSETKNTKIVPMSYENINKSYDIYKLGGVENTKKTTVSSNARSLVVKGPESTSKKSPSGAFKQTLVVGGAGNDLVKVSYTGTWLKAPKNRLIDLFGCYCKNATPEPGTIHAKYTCVRKIDGALTNLESHTYNEDKKIKVNDCGAAASANLKNNTIGGAYIYVNHSVNISYEATIDTREIPYIAVYGEYYHQESSLEVNPSLTLSYNGAIDISASVSISKVDRMHDMTPNVLLKFYY